MDTGGVTEAYLLSQFFKGFWGSTQVRCLDEGNICVLLTGFTLLPTLSSTAPFLDHVI